MNGLLFSESLDVGGCKGILSYFLGLAKMLLWSNVGANADAYEFSARKCAPDGDVFKGGKRSV